MSDNKKTFHEIALESSLFKGRRDWYFCYLKSEKIAQVLSVLSEKIPVTDRERFLGVLADAAELPGMVAYFVAGEVSVQSVLAAVFSLLSDMRLSSARGILAQDTALYIVAEYENIAEKLINGERISPFVSAEDFSVPEYLNRKEEPEALLLSHILGDTEARDVKTGYKKQLPSSATSSREQNERSATILNFVLQNKGVSIKDIGAMVPNCSEKTIQRELAVLISQGRIKREGERRWSVYKPI